MSHRCMCSGKLISDGYLTPRKRLKMVSPAAPALISRINTWYDIDKLPTDGKRLDFDCTPIKIQNRTMKSRGSTMPLGKEISPRRKETSLLKELVLSFPMLLRNYRGGGDRKRRQTPL